MRNLTTLAVLATALGLVACNKKPASPAPASTPATAAAPTPAPAPSAPASAQPTEAELERAQKLHKLEFALLEDKYMNDPKAQWATGASSGPLAKDESDESKAVTGPVDDTLWFAPGTAGMAWLQTDFAKPVAATEVRVVVRHGADTIAKLDLQDTGGAWHTVWSGLSEEQLGEDPRVWWVRRFEKTPYQVKAVKVSIAAMNGSARSVDAVQLVGE